MNAPAEDTKLLAELDAVLAADSMVGQWKYDDNLERAIGGPRPSGAAHAWGWDSISEKLLQACEAMPDSKTARRTLAFLNPGLPKPGGGTTHSLLAAVQMVLPGELAWAHRHSLAALRFCMRGNPDLYTVVDGERCVMETNDLIITPAWSWHDHHNEGAEPGVWLDALDLPMVMGLNQIAYEKFGDSSQPVRPGPAQGAAAGKTLRYAWKEMERHLGLMRGGKPDPHQGIFLEYLDAKTGAPALPAISCNVRMLPGGFVTKPWRSTACSVFLVLEGSGRTVVGDREIAWSKHDVVAIPQWIAHHHVNDSATDRALMFVMNDSPLQNVLGIYRDEAF